MSKDVENHQNDHFEEDKILDLPEEIPNLEYLDLVGKHVDDDDQYHNIPEIAKMKILTPELIANIEAEILYGNVLAISN